MVSMWWFRNCPVDVRRTDRTRVWSRNKAKSITQSALSAMGWILWADHKGPSTEFTFLARKGDTQICVLISGCDSPLLLTMVKDFNYYAAASRLVCVYVCGEQLDPRAPEWISESSILLHVSALARLDDLISSVVPRIRGAIDLICVTHLISGWAKVTPSKEDVIVKAQIGSELVGEAIANIFREDLKVEGSGYFAFNIQLLRHLKHSEITSDLIVNVFHVSWRVGQLLVGPHTTIRDL
jgi:hypothetical protein